MNKAYLESEYNIGYFIENVEGNSYGMLHEMSFQKSLFFHAIHIHTVLLPQTC